MREHSLREDPSAWAQWLVAELRSALTPVHEKKTTNVRLTPKQRRLAKLQRQCTEFNAANPVGTPVTLKKFGGRRDVRTEIRTPAQVMHGNSVVVWLQGQPGFYRLERVSRTQP